MQIDKRKVNIIMAEQMLTLSDVCEKGEVHHITLQRVLSGKQQPQPVTIGKIARALNVPVESIIKED